MRPSSGVSKPASIRGSVVLPQPEGPSGAKNSPGNISSDTRSTAATPEKRLLTPANRTSGRAAGSVHGPKARRACSAYSGRSSRWRRPQPSATLTAGDRLLNSVACPIETDTPVRYRLSTHAIAAETAGQETWLSRLDGHQCCSPGLAAECWPLAQVEPCPRNVSVRYRSSSSRSLSRLLLAWCSIPLCAIHMLHRARALLGLMLSRFRIAPPRAPPPAKECRHPAIGRAARFTRSGPAVAPPPLRPARPIIEEAAPSASPRSSDQPPAESQPKP
jgi:hypothetical protein